MSHYTHKLITDISKFSVKTRTFFESFVQRRGRHDSRFGWLPVTPGYQHLSLRVVTVYHLLPEFWSQGGYRLPLGTTI